MSEATPTYGGEMQDRDEAYRIDPLTSDLARQAFARQTGGETKVVNVHACQRCGGQHRDLSFRELTNPADEWGWWAMCPTLREPLLMRVSGEG